MNRDETVLKYLTKVSNDIATHKYHFNNRKMDGEYAVEVVRILADIQDSIRQFRKLVWSRRGRGKAVINRFKNAE